MTHVKSDSELSQRRCATCGQQIRTIPLDYLCQKAREPSEAFGYFTYEYPCLCYETVASDWALLHIHWILLVRMKRSPGWEPPDPAPPRVHDPLCRFIHLPDHGNPPAPRYCGVCKVMVDPVNIREYETSGLRELLDFGPPRRPTGRPPLRVIEYYYPCLCTERPPYSHWMVRIRLKNGVGWEEERA